MATYTKGVVMTRGPSRIVEPDRPYLTAEGFNRDTWSILIKYVTNNYMTIPPPSG